MKKADFIWVNGQLVAWEEATSHVLSHTLHYGGGAFEGIRFYETAKGPAVFRLQEHIERLFYSCGVLGLELPYSQSDVIEAISHTIKSNKQLSGYIRPLAFWGAGDLRIVSKDLPAELIIATWPIGSYLPAELVNVKVSSKIRIHPQSTVTDAKLCGHYLNSFLASKEIKGSQFHEVLLLDHTGHVAEGAGENVFFVDNGVLKTPPTGNILPGITRSTVFELANLLQIPYQEIPLTVSDAENADEAFFSGTAVEITAIGRLNDAAYGTQMGEITKAIRDHYGQLVRGELQGFDDYLTYIH